MCRDIAADLRGAGLPDASMLAVDYFIWDELQVEDNLSKIYTKKKPDLVTEEEDTSEGLEFIKTLKPRPLAV